MTSPRLVVVLAFVSFGVGCNAPPGETGAAAVGSDTAEAALTSSDAALAAPDGDVSAAPSPVLIDSAIPPAVAGVDGWNYEQSASADLDGDGRVDRVVLTARVEMYRGRPAWDDGQPWQVYVEPADGARTYLYAQRLQLGTLTMRITAPSDGEPPTIVLLEHLPHRLSVYEASYTAPDSVTLVTRFQRELDPRGDTASPDLP